jgi:Domain of unknown function (DUF4116)
MSDLRARLNKILDLHGQALAEAVGQREPNSQEAQLPAKNLILRFAGADPTDGKSRTQWMVKTYIKDEHFKLEDLGRADAALAAFERFKRKLPREQRELSRLTSFRALEVLVAPFVKAEERARLTRDLSTATGRELRRLECVKARDESIIIQEAEGLPTIAVPMTEFASKWWGKGTKWCTAAEKDNAFAQYHEGAPLIVVVCPDGEKFQMYVTKDDFQFMDNTDNNISEEIILERWSELQSLLYWAIEQNGWVLKYISTEYMTSKICILAVEQDGATLEYVPEDKKTVELCRLAVQHGLALKNVPEKYITPALCRLAVVKDGRALLYVPKNYKSPELCRLAIEQDGEAFHYVPEVYRPALYYIAVEQDGKSLRHVPEEFRTTELCRIAVVQNGLALEHLPHDLTELPEKSLKEQKTVELYRLAIQQNGRALLYVPEEFRTPELCRIAIEQNGQALLYVPKDKRTSELCRLAVEQDGHALAYISKEQITSELCRLAVEQSGRALNHVPKKHKTLELCRLAIEQNGMALFYVPEEYKTPELLALIPPVQPNWHPDILEGLHYQSKPFQDSQNKPTMRT